MKIQNISISKIKPYQNNPRNNAEAVQYVANSIKEFGFKQPIVIDKNFEIVAGHTRYFACKKLGIKEVPCVMADDLTDEQVKAYRIADNSTGEAATWDFDLLNVEIDGLDFDFEDFGLDLDFLNEQQETEACEAEITEDEVPEVDEESEPTVKMGQVWALGQHRLLCGDSTSEFDIKKVLNGEVADLVFTDPPYGMKKQKDGILNDNLNFDDLIEFNKKWIPLTFANLKNNGSWYCWGIDEPLMDIYSNILKPMIKENKITFRNFITWNKGSAQGRTSKLFNMYPVASEKCLFIMRGVHGFNNNSENYFNGFEPIRSYLNVNMQKCGGVKNWKKALNNQMGKHYFTKSQWSFPTEENYKKLHDFAAENGINAFLKPYEDLQAEYEAAKIEFNKERAYFDNTHDSMSDVWNFQRTQPEERELTGKHVTPKPLALCSRAIKSSSRENEIVLDVFGGSGSTLIACEQLNRKCRIIELSPKYCDVIIKRYETLTGDKARLLSE